MCIRDRDLFDEQAGDTPPAHFRTDGEGAKDAGRAVNLQTGAPDQSAPVTGVRQRDHEPVERPPCRDGVACVPCVPSVDDAFEWQTACGEDLLQLIDVLRLRRFDPEHVSTVSWP